jgi:hypothetical protein
VQANVGEVIAWRNLFWALSDAMVRDADRFIGFAEECMAEYDLDRWKVPDRTDPGELSCHVWGTLRDQI